MKTIKFKLFIVLLLGTLVLCNRGDKMKEKKCNIYKPGSAKYYRDMLNTISLVAFGYDGFNPNSAKQMRELVDELKKMADDALGHEKLYCELED